MQLISQTSDYKLPSPITTPPANNAPMTRSPEAPASDVILQISDTQIVIGVLLILLVAVLAYFLKRSLTSHLIDTYASPEAALRTGWMFFFFSIVLAATAIFGFLGNLWFVLPFIVPMGGLAVVSFVIFLILYFGARPRR